MNERGFGSLEWLIGVTVVVIPAAVAVLSLAPLVERATAATAAAQRAARAVALAPDDGAAHDAVVAVVADLEGRYCEESCATVVVLPSSASGLERGGWVEATVSLRMPAVSIPFLGSVASFTHTVVHREAVAPYRSLP